MKLSLIKYSFFSGMLAFAGLPIYLHAPKYFLDNYDISLTIIGVTLLVLRCLDFIQDPLIGWGLDVVKICRSSLVKLMGLTIAISMVATFSFTAIGNPLVWFVICMIFLFSSFSVLSILFYSQGVLKAKSLGQRGHIKLAVWRETGGLVGVCLASVLPVIFTNFGIEKNMAWFSISFAVVVLISIILCQKNGRSVYCLKVI